VVVPGRGKVLNVITKLAVGGAQETALRSCAVLAAEGWESVLVAGPDSSPEGDLFGEAARLGLRRVTVPTLHRRVRPWADLLALVFLVRLFRRERPDVVHTHSSKAGILGRLAARVAGVPVVVHTVHGWSFHDDMGALPRALAIAAERLAARLTSALVVVCAHDADLGRRARIGRPGSYRLVRSGIDLAAMRTGAGRAEARALLGVPDGTPLIGTVTRLCRQKDPGALVRAARRIVDDRPEVHLVVVGDGPTRAEVSALVHALGLVANVTLLGNRADVAAILPAFDAFVLTSRWEGLPRVVIEAMAAGVPVVATDVGGVSEVVRDGVSGLLVPAGQPDSVARAALRVLFEPGLAGRLRESATASLSGFDIADMARGIEDLYDDLMTRGRSRPLRRRMARAVATAVGHEAA
jgi:glycosyltransferase involved in cell wall biosynthesis